MSLPRHRLLHQLLISQHHFVQSPFTCARKFYVSSVNRSSETAEWPKDPNPTPYEIFGLPPTASSTEIKKRYYQLAKKYHPDSRFGSGEAEQERLQRFRQVVQANELISASRTRRMSDKEGFGWGDIEMNDIMGDPAHWKGNYEGRFRSTESTRPRRPEGTFEGFFDGNTRAQPYYTSNANFAGGIIVIMVLLGVLQFSHVHNTAQRAMNKRRTVHAQASLNLRDARSHARDSGRRDMIEAFQQRRDVKSGIYNDDEIGRVLNGRR